MRPCRALFLFQVVLRIHKFCLITHRTLAIVIIHLYIFDCCHFSRLLLIGCQSRNLYALFQFCIWRLHKSNFWNQHRPLYHSLILLRLFWCPPTFIVITTLFFLCELFELRHMDVIAIIWARILGCVQDMLDRLSLKHVVAVI